MVIQDVADRICQLTSPPTIDENNTGNRGISRTNRSNSLNSGVCLVAILSGPNGIEIIQSLSKGNNNTIFAAYNGIQVSELTNLIFGSNNISTGLPTTATLDSCTCCVIKPHAVKTKQIGN